MCLVLYNPQKKSKEHFLIRPLHLARVNVTIGSMRIYLDPTEVTQVVPLLQDTTAIHFIQKVCCVSHHNLKSMGEIPGYRQRLWESWTGP